MQVTTSKYEISGKNHIFSTKTKPSRAQSTRHRKNSLEKSSILAQDKSCVLLLYWPPFYMWNWLHSNGSKWQITILLTDDQQLQDRKVEYRSQMFVYRLSPFSFPHIAIFSPFPKERACSQATSMLASYTSPVEAELFFSIQTLSFVTINLHGCWPREYMCSIH